MKAMVKVSSVIPVLFVSLVLSGCTVSELSSTGGSRADGTIVMSVEYGEFDHLDINKEKALASATRRCQSWGYNAAQPFDAGLSQCSVSSGFGCSRYIYSLTYQCIQ